MRTDRGFAAIVALVSLLAARSVLAAPDPQAADDAFDEGDNARALALYDEILDADPNDMNALLRSGKLLSWDHHYDEALARYDRALTREPNNTAVLLERAKVFLWSKRYDEAVTGFARVLENDPKEPWALCGTAQAYAWRGRRKQARPFYERALAAQPGMKEAMLGLAYCDLEDGDTTKALERAKALEVTDSADPEVVQLIKDVKHARASWVQIGWDALDDSEENAMATYRAEGGFSLPARLDLRLGYAHTGLHGAVPGNADAAGDVDALFGVLGWQPRPGHRAEFRLGAAHLSDSAGHDRTMGVGGVTYAFPMAGWTGRATIAHDPFLYSPLILDNEIDVTSFSFNASGLVTPRARVEANAGYGDFSDGNKRTSTDAGAWYVASWQKQTLLAGGVVRYFGFSEDLDHGYFDPSKLLAVMASVRSDGSIGSSAWQYEAAVEAGTQWFTLHDVPTSHEPLWNVTGFVSRPLPHGLLLQLFAGYGNSSAAAGPGFRSRSGGFRLRYTIGG